MSPAGLEAAAIKMSYCGYLKAYVPHIMALDAAGAGPTEIGEILSISVSMVSYILKKYREPKKPEPVRVVTTTLPWKTWTPEMQAAEFEMGYTH